MEIVTPCNYNPNGATTWFHKKTGKSNQYCPYCGLYIGDGNIETNKEHLIGRNFTPNAVNSGTNFNFIFRACKHCNTKKSDMERHVSSVTLFNSPAKIEDPLIFECAENKGAKDYHPDMKKIVRESFSKVEVKYQNFASFNFNVPPQLNREYCKQLAYYHVQGLFTLTTSRNYRDKNGGMRLLINPKDFFYIDNYIHNDWGNERLQGIVKMVETWPCLANVETGKGFFKAILKISKTGEWFWGLEWNKYLRVVGLICSPDKGIEVVAENWTVG